MAYTIIRRSHKKIIWNTLCGSTLRSLSLIFILVIFFLAILFVFQNYKLLNSDEEYLKCTAQGFYYKPNPRKTAHFYAWEEIEELAFRRIRGKYTDSYRIDIYFYSKENLKSKSFLSQAKRRVFFFSQPADLVIPIFLLDIGLPKKVFETMKYFEREWRIEQNCK